MICGRNGPVGRGERRGDRIQGQVSHRLDRLTPRGPETATETTASTHCSDCRPDLLRLSISDRRALIAAMDRGRCRGP